MDFDLETALTASKYTAALVPLIVLGAFLLVTYRSGSVFPLLAGLWKLTGGKNAIANASIARYVQDQHDLASFKFFSHIQTARVDDAARLIGWTEQHRIPMSRIKSCGKHFDIEHLSINEASLPSKGLVVSWLCFGALALICATASFSAILFMQNTYMSFKDDGQRFVITQEGIRTLDSRLQVWSRSEGLLNEATCKSLPPQTAAIDMSLSIKQSQLLCEALGSPELQRLRDKSLFAQRLAMAMLAGLFYWGLWICVSCLSQAQRARKLLDQLADIPPVRKNDDAVTEKLVHTAPV